MNKKEDKIEEIEEFEIEEIKHKKKEKIIRELSENENNKEVEIFTINPDLSIDYKKVQKNQPKTKEQIEYKAKIIKEIEKKIANGRKLTKTKRLCPICLQTGVNFDFAGSDCYDEKIDDKTILTICLECGTETILDIESMEPILAKFVVLDEIFRFNKYTMNFDDNPISSLKGLDIKLAYRKFKDRY